MTNEGLVIKKRCHCKICRIHHFICHDSYALFFYNTLSLYIITSLNIGYNYIIENAVILPYPSCYMWCAWN